MTRFAKPAYEFGSFCLEVAERRLLRDGEPVALAPKVFDTLLALIEQSGHLVEKEELISRLWPDTFVEEATLARNISDLRKALGETAGQRYIETVPKRGYRFIAKVRQLPATDILVHRRTRSRLVVSEEVESPRPVTSLAVLPFKLLSTDEGEEYLGLGMADALITRLSNICRLIVRPTSSIFRYEGSKQDLVAAGRELKVESVLDGSIQRSKDRIRVTVQLVNVERAASLWADKFDDRFSDIFAVEDSISERVVNALTVKLTEYEKKRLTTRHTLSTEAYQFYLKGRYYWNKRTEEALKKGIDCFERAIEVDPNYAPAFGGLADCYTKLGDVGITALPPQEAFAKARVAVLRALEIDDSLGEAHASLAHLHMHRYEWLEAEEEFKRAVELNPSYPTAHHWYAYCLALTGRPDQALAEISLAAELDLLSLIITTDLGEILYFARRYDEAIGQIEKVLEMDPHYFAAHVSRARVLEQKGMYTEAIEEFQKALAISGGSSDTLASLAHTYALSGKRAEALKVVKELGELSSRKYVSPYHVAIIHAALGDRDNAFALLNQAYEEQAEWMIYLGVDPRLDPLRGDPGFSELLRRAGLA
jgi:TolB-like protein/Flp pilus assembly protein TadD